MKRVAITGLGMVTPLACGVEETWARLLAGQSGAGPITRFDASACATRYACEIPRGDGSNGSFDPDRWMAARDRRKVDEFIVYAMAAADQAVADAGWTPQDAAARDRTGVMIGSGIGGLATIAETATTLKEKGPRRVSPFFIAQFADQSRLGAGVDPLRFHGPEPRGGHGLFDRGACNRDAARIIRAGEADVMVAGGAENPICEIGIAGFNACKALSTGFAEMPERASRPLGRGPRRFRDGRGRGIVVLEDMAHAPGAGRRIHAEVLGYGMSGDAYHITAPSEDGDGAFRAMQAAIRSAGMTPGRYRYVNAHGTSTMADVIELAAVERVMGDAAARLTMSSTKSAIGHLLGAAGRGRGDLLRPGVARSGGAADAQP